MSTKEVVEALARATGEVARKRISELGGKLEEVQVYAAMARCMKAAAETAAQARRKLLVSQSPAASARLAEIIAEEERQGTATERKGSE